MTYHESIRVAKNLGDETVIQAVNVDTSFNPLPNIFVTEAREGVDGKFKITTIDHNKERVRLFPEIAQRVREFKATGIDLTTGEPAAPRLYVNGKQVA